MADYNITAVTRRKVFSGSAGVGPYAFTFPILTQTDIVVYKNSTKLTLTTDYTVSINGTNGTGSVTLVVAATASDTITIIGARAIQRTTDFVTAGDLTAASLNEQLDGLTIMVQQLAEENKRTMKAPPYDPEAVDDGGILNMQLPTKEQRAGKVLAFDGDGNPSFGAASLPSSLTATYYPRVNAGGTAYELRAPATVRSDIGADNASNLTSGTVSNSLLPGTIDGKTITNVTITSGSITGITDLAVADGGTGASTAAGARANLSAAVLGANNDITSMTGVTGGISSPDFIQFDAAATVTDATGKLYYNKEDQFQTLAFQMNGNVVQKVGEERYYRVKLSGNATKGQVMMFTGTIGASGGLTAAPATGLTAEQSNYILGIATESGSTNDWIFVTEFGEVKGIDTTGGAETWTQGDVLYYNPAVTGGLTKNKPASPNAIAVMAAVVYADSSNGILFVRPTFGSVLGGTDGNVQFGSLADGDVIVYDATDQRWENRAQSTLTAGSVNGSATITSGTISGITALSVAGTASSTGEIKLYEDTDNGTNYVGWKAPASISADISWTLPAADGVSGQLLSTDGSGTLSWTTPAGGGDVSGPASSTDNAIVRFDSTSGKAIQNSVATLSDTGVLTTAEVSTDTISEKTAAAGVTIDGVLLKDSAVTTDTINEKTAAAGVTIDGVLLKDAAVNTDTINEKTSAAGVTVDGVLLKDAAVSTDTINEKTSAAGVTIDGVVLKDGGATLTSPIILADGTASSPSVTNTGDTNTGIYFSGDNAIGFATDGTQRGEFDASGNFKFNSGYGSVATAYGCRAWVNFDGTSNSANLSGTYSQSGTTVTVTATAHGLVTGNSAYLDFTSGTAVDGDYEVTVTDADTFTVTQASRTTSGNVTLRRNTIRGSGNVSSVSDSGVGEYIINFTTAMPDVNYVVSATSGSASYSCGSGVTGNRTANYCVVRNSYQNGTGGGVSADAGTINVAVFR